MIIILSDCYILDTTSDVVFSENINCCMDVFVDGGWITGDCKAEVLKIRKYPLKNVGQV